MGIQKIFILWKNKKRIFKNQVWLKIGIIAHCVTAWCTPKRFVLIFRFPTHKYTFHFAFFQTVSCSILKEIEVFVRNCDTSSFFASYISVYLFGSMAKFPRGHTDFSDI